MLRPYKRNAPVSVKEECVFVQAIKREYGCVYVCLSSSTKSLVDSYVSVHVIEAILEVLKSEARK